jgi:transposase-like protein
VEVVTSAQLRRRWTPEQKLEIVKQTNEPGSSVSLVARQHGLTAASCFSRKLPQIENNMKIEASISLRRRDEEVKVHGEPDCCNLG